MIESHPIPAIARTAMALLDAQYQHDSARIGEQTVAALGLDPNGHYRADFTTGVVTREIAGEITESLVPPNPPSAGG